MPISIIPSSAPQVLGNLGKGVANLGSQYAQYMGMVKARETEVIDNADISAELTYNKDMYRAGLEQISSNLEMRKQNGELNYMKYEEFAQNELVELYNSLGENMRFDRNKPLFAAFHQFESSKYMNGIYEKGTTDRLDDIKSRAVQSIQGAVNRGDVDLVADAYAQNQDIFSSDYLNQNYMSNLEDALYERVRRTLQTFGPKKALDLLSSFESDDEETQKLLEAIDTYTYQPLGREGEPIGEPVTVSLTGDMREELSSYFEKTWNRIKNEQEAQTNALADEALMKLSTLFLEGAPPDRRDIVRAIRDPESESPWRHLGPKMTAVENMYDELASKEEARTRYNETKARIDATNMQRQIQAINRQDKLDELTTAFHELDESTNFTDEWVKDYKDSVSALLVADAEGHIQLTEGSQSYLFSMVDGMQAERAQEIAVADAKAAKEKADAEAETAKTEAETAKNAEEALYQDWITRIWSGEKIVTTEGERYIEYDDVVGDSDGQLGAARGSAVRQALDQAGAGRAKIDKAAYDRRQNEVAVELERQIRAWVVDHPTTDSLKKAYMNEDISYAHYSDLSALLQSMDRYQEELADAQRLKDAQTDAKTLKEVAHVVWGVGEYSDLALDPDARKAKLFEIFEDRANWHLSTKDFDANMRKIESVDIPGWARPVIDIFSDTYSQMIKIATGYTGEQPDAEEVVRLTSKYNTDLQWLIENIAPLKGDEEGIENLLKTLLQPIKQTAGDRALNWLTSGGDGTDLIEMTYANYLIGEDRSGSIWTYYDQIEADFKANSADTLDIIVKAFRVEDASRQGVMKRLGAIVKNIGAPSVSSADDWELIAWPYSLPNAAGNINPGSGIFAFAPKKHTRTDENGNVVLTTGIENTILLTMGPEGKIFIYQESGGKGDFYYLKASNKFNLPTVKVLKEEENTLLEHVKAYKNNVARED